MNIPFDLKRVTLDGDLVQFEDGHKCKFLWQCKDGRLYFVNLANDQVFAADNEGKNMLWNRGPLYMAPKEIDRWIAVPKLNVATILSVMFSTKEEAQAYYSEIPSGCDFIKITLLR